MKKYKLNIFILVIVSILVMFLIMKDNFYEIINNLINVDIILLLIAIIFMFLNVLFQSFSMHLYLKEIDSKYKFKDTLSLMISTLFFNAITPFSSGGQPFQIIALKHQGIKVTDSGNAILQNFLSYQLSLIIVGTITIILNKFLDIIPSTTILKNVVIIGYIVNISVLLIMTFLGKAKKANTKIFEKIFDFIFGFKFIKNRQNLRETAINKINDFYDRSKYFSKNKKIFITSIFYNMLSLAFLYSISLFVFLSVDKLSLINLLDSIVCSSYTFFIGSFVPVPGGTGGLEYSFMQFFKGLSSNSIISTSMILWRFVTYYLPMIVGAIFLIFINKRVKK